MRWTILHGWRVLSVIVVSSLSISPRLLNLEHLPFVVVSAFTAPTNTQIVGAVVVSMPQHLYLVDKHNTHGDLSFYPTHKVRAADIQTIHGLIVQKHSRRCTHTIWDIPQAVVRTGTDTCSPAES